MDVGDLALWLLVLVAVHGLLVFHVAWVGLVKTRRWLMGRRNSFRDPGPGFALAGAPPSVAFLVAAHNEERTIGPCIESILAQTVPSSEIIVIDDASTDGTASVVERYRARGVRLIRLMANRGKTSAIEIGLEATRARFVAITDADSLVDARYLEHVLPHFEDAEVAAVAGRVDSLPQSWVTAARQVEYMIAIEVDRHAESEMSALLVLPGVSTTYRTSVLREMGFERDTIAEDIDLTFRLHRAGRQMRLERDATVRTSDPLTLKDYYRQVRRWDNDFWLTIVKHRAMIGRTRFGIVSFPLTAAATLVHSVIVLGVPLYLLVARPGMLPYYIIGQLAWDAALAVTAALLYRRWDVLWACASRYPTRVLSRISSPWAFARVLAGKPLRTWRKLERRSTASLQLQQAMAR